MARIKYNLSAFKEIRTSQQARNAVGEMAESIAAASGGVSAGVYSDRTDAPRNRARAAVIAAKGEAVKDPMVILRNVEAGRR